MPCLALSVELGDLDAEFAACACMLAGALSVTFSDAADQPVLEPQPGELRLWQRTRLQALFPAGGAPGALTAALAGAFGIDAELVSACELPDRAWEREWLRDFHPMRFGRRLWVCPRHEGVDDSQAVVVRLDPGLAFGTGTHPSTAMCLTWLDQATLMDRQVVDYGCGSGLLAIAALKLGARRAFAYDIDPQALLATQGNAADNAVQDRLRLCARAHEIPAGCDIVLANILAEVLISLRAQFATLLPAGGRILLSGILAAQAAEVAAAFLKWFDMKRFACRDDWVALAGTRL